MPEHKKLIVIHGWGGTYLEAAALVTDLLNVESFRSRGAFWVPRRSATVLRHLLSEPSEDRYINALRKRTVGRFLLSPPAPRDAEVQKNANFTRFSEERLRQDFPEFGIPISPGARRKRAAQLKTAAEAELTPVIDVLNRLLHETSTPLDQSRTEAAILESLQELAHEAGLKDSVLPLLENLREMHETGGDLDTVASAALYARSIVSAATSAGKQCLYGHEFQFVFVNYHESLRSLAKLAPAALYAGDLPLGAFPELEDDIRFLHEKGVYTARFEDHHPYLPEREKSLSELQAQGKLGFFALSGPLQGSEIAEGEQKCAADMVYENTILNTSADCSAARRLREAAHGEDFVTNRTTLGILLTDLIKGGICKVELAQILLDAMDADDAMQRLESRGWAALPGVWKADVDATADTLLENTSRITLADGKTTIIVALAVHAEAGKPKLPTGKAIEFFARTFPDAQYAFYCYGSSLMVARRLDHGDTTLNLGSLMPRIGSSSDGGHAGAAVCRPDANPHYPARLLGRVTPANFNTFARYLAGRLTAVGYPVDGIRNVSVPARSRWGGGNRKLIVILVTAAILGLLLMALFPSYRPAKVRESNVEFIPFILIDSDQPLPEGGDR